MSYKNIKTLDFDQYVEKTSSIIKNVYFKKGIHSYSPSSGSENLLESLRKHGVSSKEDLGYFILGWAVRYIGEMGMNIETILALNAAKKNGLLDHVHEEILLDMIHHTCEYWNEKHRRRKMMENYSEKPSFDVDAFLEEIGIRI